MRNSRKARACGGAGHCSLVILSYIELAAAAGCRSRPPLPAATLVNVPCLLARPPSRAAGCHCVAKTLRHAVLNVALIPLRLHSLSVHRTKVAHTANICRHAAAGRPLFGHRQHAWEVPTTPPRKRPEPRAGMGPMPLACPPRPRPPRRRHAPTWRPSPLLPGLMGSGSPRSLRCCSALSAAQTGESGRAGIEQRTRAPCLGLLVRAWQQRPPGTSLTRF